jgi:sugar/nucleoside kinase (ribokinase family)
MKQRGRAQEQRPLICAGEFFFDLIFFGLRQLPRLGEELVTRNFAFALGGGAATTAVTAARLGRRSEIATVIGSSALDDFALTELGQRGVGVELVRREAHAIGGISVAVSVRNDRYFLTAPGANQFVEKYLLSRGVYTKLTEAQHVHFALSPTRWPPFSKLVGSLKKQRVSTSWDLGWHPEAARLAGFRRLYSQLDLVFLNEMEALRYSRERSVSAALKVLASPGQAVVVKLGRRGSIAMQDGIVYRSRSVEAKAVETTGAGDAFNGGFLDAWLENRDIEAALRAGNACGALSTRVPGGSAGAPSRAELTRYVKDVG